MLVVALWALITSSKFCLCDLKFVAHVASMGTKCLYSEMRSLNDDSMMEQTL